MKKPRIALIRGKYLTKYDMETFEKLYKKYGFTAFGSLYPIQEDFIFPTVKLPSPVDLPEFPFKLPILNRLFVDAHYLFGLEEKLKNFDIAHTAETYFHYTKQAINAKEKGIVKKVICTVFENIPFNNEGIWGRKKFKKEAKLKVDHFIAVTKGARDALVEEGVPEKIISVIPMGIDPEKFSPIGKNKRKNNETILLFVGRIEEYKGIFDLIEAFASLIDDRKLKKYSLKLIIVGKGSKEDKLKRRIKYLGIDSFIDRKEVPYERIAQVYKTADVFVGPSKKDKYWMEQFGMVFLEAMASGLPVISYSSGSIPEVVGGAGILVKEGDIQSLRRSIKDLILDSEKREELGRKARIRAIEKFSIDITSKKINEIYRKVLR